MTTRGRTEAQESCCVDCSDSIPPPLQTHIGSSSGNLFFGWVLNMTILLSSATWGWDSRVVEKFIL